MRKILIGLLALAVFTPATAQAHRYGATYQCTKAIGLPCQSTLSEDRARWFEALEYHWNHSSDPGSFTWGHHRKSPSSMWVAHRTEHTGSSDNCLVDIDRTATSFLYKIVCYYWDEGPRP